VGWGVQYTVEEDNVRYPCGIEIKTTKQRIQQDTSVTTKQELLDKMSSLHASKPDTQALIQSFLSTPEGQRYKAEASLQLANAYLQRILKELNQPNSIDQGENVIQSSSNGNTKGVRKKRGNSELDDAIQKQRDFLKWVLL
jgi:hypothetical protein